MRTLAVSAVAAVLSACAVAAPEKAVDCKGTLRPANPYGSVLQDLGQAREGSADQAQASVPSHPAPLLRPHLADLTLCGAVRR